VAFSGVLWLLCRVMQLRLLLPRLKFLCTLTGLTLVCVGCSASKPVPASPEASREAQPSIERTSGNPFAGLEVFIAPYSNADQARRNLEKTDPEQARLIAKIADTPQARWLGSWSPNVQVVADNYTKAASKRGKLSLIVAYNVPNRDCGQYSKGGAVDPASYRDWIKALGAGIGTARRAVVILEPDALAQLTECLSPADQEQRLQLLGEAVDVLQANPGVSVYLDAGHSSWVPADEMAKRLKRAGIERARGFALNVSNFRADAELIAYGDQLVALLGDTHYVIDSSRNGNGAAPGNVWCNPEGRALGRRPTTDTGNPHIDAFAWLKSPGESDGDCDGAPKAGQWFAARALEMARNAKW
jgi:endoglucanase